MSEAKSVGTVQKLLLFAKDCRYRMVLSVVLAIIGVLCGLLPYFSVARLIADFYYGSVTFSSVVMWSVLAIVGYTLKITLTTVSSMKSHEAAFTIMKNIREQLALKMEKVPMGVMIDTPTGTLKALVVDIVEKLEKPLAHILPEMTSNILAPLSILITLFILDWRMGLATLVTVPLGLFIMSLQMIE